MGEVSAMRTDSESLQNSDRKCGCHVHYSNEAYAKSLNISVNAMNYELFSPDSSMWQKFFEQMSFQQIALNSQAGGSKAAEMLLPRVFGNDVHVKLSIVDKYLLKQPNKRYVVESIFQIDGIPGGITRVLVRFCITSIDSMSLNLLITFDVIPPKTSFFKESFRHSLTSYFHSFFDSLGKYIQTAHLLEQEALDHATTHEDLSLWRRSHPNSRRQSTFVHVYFDWKAFAQSLFWIVPIAVFVYLLLHHRLLSVHMKYKGNVGARMEKISSINQQLQIFLDREKIASRSTALQAEEMIDRISERVNNALSMHMYHERNE